MSSNVHDPNEIAETVPLKVDELDETLVRQLTQVAQIELHPIAAFFGGVVAQEVVKFTGKFTPLKQWMHLDWVEVLPETRPVIIEAAILSSSSSPSSGSSTCQHRMHHPRYLHMHQMFGTPFMEQLGNIRTFVVGCGALGCEYLKNFAMIGVGCGPKGLITVRKHELTYHSIYHSIYLSHDLSLSIYRYLS
jgi:ubiquitin-activating enzyme E1